MRDENPAEPQVTVHYAQSLDGRIATRSGHSQWISCGGSLRLAHELRAQHDAVLVGVGTVLADNPRLTVRLAPGVSPVRIVIDSALRIPLDAHLLVDGAAPTIVATTDRAPPDRIRRVRNQGAETLLVDRDHSGRVDLQDLLRRLGARGISTVLIEGGSAVITSAFRTRTVDRLVVCIAPKLIGDGIPAVGDLEIARMDDALRFVEVSFTSLEEDVIFDGRLERTHISGDATVGGARLPGR